MKFYCILSLFKKVFHRIPFFSWNSISLEAAYLSKLERNRFGLDTCPDNGDCKTPPSPRPPNSSSSSPREETSRICLARVSFGVAVSRCFSGTPSWSSCFASLRARISWPSALSAHITWSHIWIYKRKSPRVKRSPFVIHTMADFARRKFTRTWTILTKVSGCCR